MEGTATGRISVGVGPIGWVNDDLREWGAETPGTQVMDEIAAAGFAGTEMSYKYPQDPSELRQTLAARGLVLSAAYRWTNLANPRRLEEEIAATKRHIDFCRTAGARYAIVAEGYRSQHWDLEGERPRRQPREEEHWKSLIEGHHACGRYARERGITLVFHPHGGTGVESEAEIDRLMALTDPELIGLCPDTGHIFYGGGDPAAVFRRHAGRIRYVHAKDVRPEVLARVRAEGLTFKQAVMANVFCTPGTGCLDFRAIFAPLLATGFSGWIVVEAEQDPVRYPALEVSRAARAYIREVTGA